MKISLSRNTPTNSVYRDETGRPLYRVETPFKWSNKTSIISRFLPSTTSHDLHDAPVSLVKNDNESDTDIHLMGLEEEEVSQIEWHLIGKSVFKFAEQSFKVDTYFPRTGFLGWDRKFTASDGREYRWNLGRIYSLSVNDGSKAPIAQFHHRSLGILGRSHKAYLDVLPEGMHILDEIVTTFVYVETQREESEGTTRINGV